jgi:hypothetical protein
MASAVTWSRQLIFVPGRSRVLVQVEIDIAGGSGRIS